MGMTRKQVIKNLNALNAVCGQKDFYDKEMKESMRYAISSLKIDEAYQIMYEGGEVFTKDEVIGMFKDLQLEIKEMSGLCTEIHGDEWNEVNVVHSQDVLSLIQQKINALKEVEK